MAIEVKSAAATVEKWKSRAGQSQQFYADGVKGRGAKWEENTSEAGDRFAAGIQAAIANGAFARGVGKAGGSKYENGIAKKGVQRWAPGIAAAVDEYNKAITPVLQTIAAVTLGPKGPRGAEENYERVRSVGRALHEAKVAGRL